MHHTYFYPVLPCFNHKSGLVNGRWTHIEACVTVCPFLKTQIDGKQLENMPELVGLFKR